MPALQTRTPDSTAILEKLVRRIEDISTLPQVATRVMQVANDPNSTAAQMKAVMEGDAALSARVLRCVNSSAYALRIKITNLQQAIAYLGLKQIRDLAMAASVSDLFRGDGNVGPYRRVDLWRHFVAVGLCARLIAMRRKVAGFEDAFLAGLLHDIGIVLEDQYAHVLFTRVIGRLDQSRILSDVEREVLCFDHTTLGERIAETWRFPEPVRAAIRHHHASVTYRGEHIDIVRCVEVANLIVTLKDMPSVGLKLVKHSPPALAGLALTGSDVAVLSEDLDREFSVHSSLFQV